MKYRSYTARVSFSEADHLFVGEVIDTEDTIYFEADTVAGLETAFRNAVDDHLAFCAKHDIEPSRPYSGKLQLRLGSELHRRVDAAAQSSGKSINEFLTQVVASSVE